MRLSEVEALSTTIIPTKVTTTHIAEAGCFKLKLDPRTRKVDVLVPITYGPFSQPTITQIRDALDALEKAYDGRTE